jgi:hypothetical protein
VTPRWRTASVFIVSGLLLVGAGLWGAELMRADAKHEPRVGDPADFGPLTSSQYAAAVAIVQHEVDREGAHLTSATAVIRPGKVHRSNLGGSCTSGREIRIRLIGRFPHIQADRRRGAPRRPVTSVGIIADASSGRACLLGVRNAHADPYARSADLMPALSR